jgi:intracellular sulfur oxidation DsrE/DsrF family protein
MAYIEGSSASFDAMKRTLGLLLACLLALPALSAGTWVQTPYKPAKVVFEFYLDDPAKMGSALYWVRSLMNPLQADPYNYTPEELNIKVVIHGTEIVTVAKHNEGKYQELVERMRYYADLGVEFKVCGQAAEDFGYSVKDFQDFIQVVPNAMTELAHWQQEGYALITPHIYEKRFALEELR